jgi:tetratricopeptide (TPR) repeat protein
MPAKWYERQTWTDGDQLDFERRLRRARPDNRPSYLHQQAGALSRVADVGCVEAALALLDRTIREYPDYWALAGVHEDRATCYLKLGNADQAIVCYRQTFDAQRKRTIFRTAAHFSFSSFVVSTGRSDLYQEAMDALEEFKSAFVFPVEVYGYHKARAVIANHFGKMDEARESAAIALAASGMTRTALRYHPTLGLVGNADPDMLETLRRIVAG